MRQDFVLRAKIPIKTGAPGLFLTQDSLPYVEDKNRRKCQYLKVFQLVIETYRIIWDYTILYFIMDRKD